MTIREATVAKLQQLPESILLEVSNFVDFIMLKHQYRDRPMDLADATLFSRNS